MLCTLCESDRTYLYTRVKNRDFIRCCVCDCIFVPKNYHLSYEAEKLIYDKHNNSYDNLDYRKFLSNLSDPLIKMLTPGMKGLDFGSGPGPALHLMLEQQGYPCDIYDPFYANNKAMLNKSYDFVTCSETAEHFCQPKQSWNTLFSLIKPGGYLGVMTLRHDTTDDFLNWWYKNDETHVVFYSKLTFEYLENLYSATIAFMQARITLFRC